MSNTGNTKRALKVRISKYRNNINIHLVIGRIIRLQVGHAFELNNIEILDYEVNWRKEELLKLCL